MRLLLPLLIALALTACTPPAPPNANPALPAVAEEPAPVVPPAPVEPPPAVAAPAQAAPEPVPVVTPAPSAPEKPAPVASKPAAPAPKLPGLVVYPAPKKGQIVFNHAGHAGRLACASCHATLPPQKVAVSGMAAGHALCRTCHQQSGGKAPTACAGCHGKP